MVSCKNVYKHKIKSMQLAYFFILEKIKKFDKVSCIVYTCMIYFNCKEKR